MPRPGSEASVTPSRDELIAQLQLVDWTKWRPQVLELLLHRSRVLEAVPDNASEWLPIVHDSLLFFLDHLGDERLLERLLDQAAVPEDAPRGEQVLQFLAQSPTLQKIGQIFARNPEVPVDLREALQVLENGLSTTSRDQVMDFILQDIGPDTIEAYQVHCAEEVLAEATIGVILPCTLVLPGETRVRQAVAKVIKPAAMSALQEELAISEFPKWRKYLISLSFRGQSSVRPVQVGGFDVNIVIHRSTAVRGRGGPARHDAWPPSLGAILAHTDGPCGS